MHKVRCIDSMGVQEECTVLDGYKESKLQLVIADSIYIFVEQTRHA